VSRSRRTIGPGPAAEIAAPWSRAVLVAALFVVVGCGPAQSGAASTSPAPSPVEPSIVSPEPATPEPSGSAPAASVSPSPIADAVLLAAGDIAACSKEGDSATAAILARYPDARVQTLGDNAYDKGTPRQFGCFDDTWGVAYDRMQPALGGHDYMTENAAGYFGYFADRLAPYAPTANEPTMGWYAYDLGAWRIIVLNSICDRIGGCDAGSPQVTWLKTELAQHQARCSLAVIHNPRFSSGRKENEPRVQPLWEELHAAGVEMVLSGDNHAYERLSRMTPTGTKDPAGIRQFVVGTGGRSHYSFSEGAIHPNTEARDDQTYGLLMLTLQDGAFDWEFVPQAGKRFTDSGSEDCH
jgi:hypothetical protein